MQVHLNLNSADDYRLFLRIKALPRFSFTGRVATFPDEYARILGLRGSDGFSLTYEPRPFLFDYQRDISRLAIRKRKFAVFADCGLGKSLIMLEFARQCAEMLSRDRCILIVSPLMVVKQTLSECRRFYGDTLPVEQVSARDLPAWLTSGTGRIGITNYESIKEGLPRGRLGSLILDESSLLKSHYGVWGQRLIELGKGLDYKLCLTGTPAPNDRIEYANHAVFLDQFPTVNSFLAKFFVNRGETGERWELKQHALRPFWRALSHWSIFLTNPAVYGWKDNAGTIPPIHVHIHDVPLTEEQNEAVREACGGLVPHVGGITSRSTLGQLAKGRYKGRDLATNKPAFIRDLIASWPDESTLVWCVYNAEQETMERALPGAASITGSTPYAERERIIADFQAGRVRTLISKADILGFGLNLQIATRQVFSGVEDSYEDFYQCVKRSNRVGSTRDLNVHLPVTDVERPMMETVLAKAKRVQQDNEEQERLFREVNIDFAA